MSTHRPLALARPVVVVIALFGVAEASGELPVPVPAPNVPAPGAAQPPLGPTLDADGLGFLDSYLFDDGEGNTALGVRNGGWVGWINQFTVASEREIVSSISVAFGIVPDGVPVKVYLWSDPNQDASPSDALVLSSASGATAAGSSDTFIHFDTADKEIGPVGTSFFVGVLMQTGPADFPIWVDQQRPNGRSWFVGGGSVSLDPDALALAPILAPIDSFGAGLAGKWMMRAGSLPAPGPAAVLGAAALLALARRRRGA